MQVILTDGQNKNVPPYMLEKLLEENRVVAFERSDGWVQVGRDPIRKGPPGKWSGKRWSDFMSERSKPGRP